jgi:hypothetical protein
VIDAAQTAIFIARKHHRRSAVRARLVDQADPPFAVPEGNEILAEQPDAPGLTVGSKVGGWQERNPKQAEQVAKGRALFNPDQPLIVLVGEHGFPPWALAPSWFRSGVQERSDPRFQTELARRPERVGSRERRAWDWRVLASLDQPDDDFDTPALELSQSIFDQGALDAAPGKFGVSETNPPLAGLTLGCLGPQEIGYRQQFL